MKKRKWFSRKFVSTFFIMLAAIVLRACDKLDNMYFSIVILTAYVVYNVIEGTIDAKALSLQIGDVKVTGNDTEKDD